jgi:hypothetical protein
MISRNIQNGDFFQIANFRENVKYNNVTHKEKIIDFLCFEIWEQICQENLYNEDILPNGKLQIN